MNRGRYVVIYDTPHNSLREGIEAINGECTVELREESSAISNNVIVSLLDTPEKAQTLVSDINKGPGITRACTLDFFNKRIAQKPRDYEGLKEISEKDQALGLENEYFVVNHENKLSLFENDMAGKTKEICVERGFQKFVLSNTFMFIAFIGQFVRIKYLESFELFYEIFAEVRDVEFSENDKYIIVHGKKHITIWEMKSMCKVFETEASGIILNEAAQTVFIKDLCEFVDFSGNMHKYNREIDKVAVCGEKMAILTKDDIKSIVFVSGCETLEKNQPNMAKADFVWSRSFLYVHKRVSGKKDLDFLECYGDGTILMYQCENEVLDFKVSDSYVVLFDSESFVTFLQRKKTLVVIGRAKKVNRVLLSMNRTGEVVAIYDNETDGVEFYGEGVLMSTHKHSYCNDIIWSKSGLFAASVSGALNFGGLVQMYTANGRLLWKRTFSTMLGFQWCSYTVLDSLLKEKVRREYDVLVTELPAINIEYATDEDDVESLKRHWIDFLRKKRALLQGKQAVLV